MHNIFMKLTSEKNKKMYWIISVVLVVLFSAALYFTNLQYETSFTNDEFMFVSVVENLIDGNGFVYSGDLYEDEEYTRAWPSSILLMAWVKLFGLSEISCRSIFALLGVFTIISSIYITYKLFKNRAYSIIACLMLLGEGSMTTYFRNVRMYSLELLLSIWTYYFLYRGLTESNPKPSNGNRKVKEITNRYLDFHWSYLLTGLAFLLLGYFNMVNSVIPLGGLFLYVVIMAFSKREKKYVLLSCLGMTVLGISAINILVWSKSEKFLFAGKLFNRFFIHSGFGIRREYLSYILGVGLTQRWFMGAVFIAVIALFLIINKEMPSIITYIASMVCFTTAFMVFMTSAHKYNYRYIIMITPWMIFLFAYVVICSYKHFKFLSYVLAAGIIFVELYYSTHQLYAYASGVNPKDTRFIEAYNTISEYYDLSDDTIPIISDKLRLYYYEQVVPKQNITVYSVFDRERDFDVWMDFAEDNPDGIVTVEQIKMMYLTQDTDKMITQWTDRLSGRGIDDSNVNVSHYCFVKPDEMYLASENLASLSESSLMINLSKEYMEKLQLDNGMGKALFVKVCFKYEDNCEKEQYFTLLIPDNISDFNSLSYTIDEKRLSNVDFKKVEEVSVDSSAAVYINGLLYDINLY